MKTERWRKEGIGIILFINPLLGVVETRKKWKIVLAHPDFHAGGHFQPLEKNGIKIRGRFLFLFSCAKNLGVP